MKTQRKTATASKRVNAPKEPTKGRFADLDKDKLRGGYYTSSNVATWLCDWAIRSSKDSVLEPSCGDGSILVAAATRLKELGAKPKSIASQLKATEIVKKEATSATNRIEKIIGKTNAIVETTDFFSWWQSNDPTRLFDVVVGNPPFIRYQTFPEPHRTLAFEIMVELGLSPNKLTNIWVPFVVAAAASLKPGGRMALVLPAELLQVTYAAQLRSFLTDRFTRIDIVACNELFFDNAEQEVVLLLADGALDQPSAGNACKVGMTEASTVAEITDHTPSKLLSNVQFKTVKHDNEKWLKYFLSNSEISFMRELRDADITANMSVHASIDVGVVTGKNEFFVLNEEQVRTLGLEGYTTPLVSRSTQLKGARINKSDWNHLATSGDRVHLLHLKPISEVKPSGSLAKYIRFGESMDVHKGFKCSVRAPWYAVPSVWTPDGFSFRQIYDFPRIVLNQAEATSTDTIHRLTCKGAKPERVIANTYTWLTAASAEIEGRSYGGGVLELEPTEAERLLMPAQLNGAMPLSECDKLTRAGKLNDVLEENARIILMGHMGLSISEANKLKEIWIKMRDRRMARRRRKRD